MSWEVRTAISYHQTSHPAHHLLDIPLFNSQHFFEDTTFWKADSLIQSSVVALHT